MHPPRVHRRRVALVALLLSVSLIAGCINTFYRTDIWRVDRPAAGDASRSAIRSPLKAHLRDGSTIVFERGATITHDSLSGDGQRYALSGTIPFHVTAVPMDSVVGVETFESKFLAAPTIAVSLAATAAGAMGAGLLAVAIFGSCPTVYADSGATGSLQAEGFSYAIAPLLEQRDVDPLRVRADSSGRLRLELRNEALETHYINHVEVLAVRHATGEQVVPDQQGKPVVVGAIVPLTRAVDRAGRDVSPTLAARDGRLFTSDPGTVRRARVGDVDDWIDIEAGALPPGDSLAVVLRLRNSLLNTILMYEGMLGGRDAADWMHDGLQRIASAVDMARWYSRSMGMRATVEGVSVPDGDMKRGLARLGDVGPIAFRDVAIVLPRAARDAKTARVRLRFVADNWRIDEVRVAGVLARPATTTLAVERVVVPEPAVTRGPTLDTAAVSALADADDRYLETRPGQRMLLEFVRDSATRATRDTATTYLIAWQGWYREWIRGAWLAEPTRTTPFVPGDAAIVTALRRWTSRQEQFEREFYSSKLPVR